MNKEEFSGNLVLPELSKLRSWSGGFIGIGRRESIEDLEKAEEE